MGPDSGTAAGVGFGAGIAGPKKSVAALTLSILLSGGLGGCWPAPPPRRRRGRGEPASDEDEEPGEAQARWAVDGKVTGPLCLGRAGPTLHGMPDCAN